MPFLRRRLLHMVLAGGLFAAGCAGTTAGPRSPDGSGNRPARVGVAAYYDSKFQGKRTASGRTYDQGELTAAHRTLPFGTRVRVTNLGNGRSVVVTVTDRGPFTRGRILDVSARAARELGFFRQGTARVRIDVL